MLNKFNNRKSVIHQGYEFSLLLLPVLSVSKPSFDKHYNTHTQRIVFDWGKSLSHPAAKVGFALLTSPTSHFFKYVVIGDNKYSIIKMQKCRSGRVAAVVSKEGPASLFDNKIIQAALAQEFPTKK